MPRKIFRNCLLIAAFLAASGTVFLETTHAGMSSVVLTEYGAKRLTGLSTALFFGLVVSTLLVRFFWGLLVKDTDWPKPTLLKSFAATFLGGLLFFLVLVMIAGSRELFSPGAWVPDGILYKLSTTPESPPPDPVLSDIELARRQALERLCDRLREPEPLEENSELRTIPFSSGLRYELPTDGPYLVVEPKFLDGKRHGIDRNTFEIVELPDEEAPP